MSDEILTDTPEMNENILNALSYLTVSDNQLYDPSLFFQ